MPWSALTAELEQWARTLTWLSVLHGAQTSWQQGDFWAEPDNDAAIQFAEIALQVADLAEQLARRALACARQSLLTGQLSQQDDLPF